MLFMNVGLVIYAKPVLADCNNPTSNAEAVQCGSNNVGGGAKTGAQATKAVNNTITTVINILSVVGGIVAVVFIIIGGFRYITSAGDSSKVGSAKNTILYAVIGLVIVALAQIIVHFVLAKATQPVCSGGHWDSGPHAGETCRS
jgi:hypothetical protein